MKKNLLFCLFGLSALVLLSGARYTSADDNSPSLSVVSSLGDTVVVTFDAAYVVGQSSSSTPLAVATLSTPLKFDIDSPYFMGIFKKKSGGGVLRVTLIAAGGSPTVSSGNVVCVAMAKDKVFASQF